MSEFERAHQAMRGMNEQQKLAWLDGWAFGVRETRERFETALAAGTSGEPRKQDAA